MLFSLSYPQKYLFVFLFYPFFLSSLFGQDEQEDPAIELASRSAELQLKDKTWFTDRSATATIYFDEVVDSPEEWDHNSSEYTIIDIEVRELEDQKLGKSMAIIRFLPRKTGLVTLNAFSFSSNTSTYQTHALQILVGEPQASSDMSLDLKPVKHTVYVGEPLRVDLSWNCALPARLLKKLELNPSFFNNSSIEVVIPRSTADEKNQIGLPLGGRRVIATRTVTSNTDQTLGLIEIPLYLRFDKPGNYVLPETRLECSKLSQSSDKFATYASYFNNGLFESVETGKSYNRLYTKSPAIEIEVIALPAENQSAEFSGLFTPLTMEVSVHPTEVKIGELMELKIKLHSDAPHGMLELPLLSHFTNLRERFIIDDNYSRVWHPGGTTFRTRIRALSTSTQAFPSLPMQLFNTSEGKFELYSTEPIPLKVSPSEGQEFIPLKSFPNSAVTLTNRPEGIWHNQKTDPMTELLNTSFALLNQAFWILLLLGPVLFLTALPFIHERRRRASDPRYPLRIKAYRDFKKITLTSPEKWPAFLRLMAVSFGATDKAWTQKDSEKALQSIGTSEDEIEQILTIHEKVDAQDYSSNRPETELNHLNTLAKNLIKRLAKSSLVILWFSLFFPTDIQASEWTEAEQTFSEAQQAQAGSASSKALYMKAALAFETESTNPAHSGSAWYNAGNAWFQAGAMGRAIAAYRQAALHSPFDQKISENLAAARAMTLNEIPVADTNWNWQNVPLAWLKVPLVLMNGVFWCILALAFLYRKRRWTALSIVSGSCVLFLLSAYLQKSLAAEQAGVVIVDSALAKKGPDYSYAYAFNEPLHDGLEFILIEQRADWSRIKMSDGRQCWLPTSQVQFIK